MTTIGTTRLPKLCAGSWDSIAAVSNVRSLVSYISALFTVMRTIIYARVHTCTHTCTHTHMYARSHTHAHTVHTHNVHIYTHSHICTLTHSQHARARTHTNLIPVAVAVSESQFGGGSGRVLLSNVRCKGTEVSLFECPRGATMTQGCSTHHNDAGVICTGDQPLNSIPLGKERTRMFYFFCFVLRIVPTLSFPLPLPLPLHQRWPVWKTAFD